MQLTEATLNKLFLNSDEEVSDKEKEMEFEPDRSEDLNDEERDAKVSVSSVTGCVWRLYASTDSNVYINLVSTSAILE